MNEYPTTQAGAKVCEHGGWELREMHMSHDHDRRLSFGGNWALMRCKGCGLMWCLNFEPDWKPDNV